MAAPIIDSIVVGYPTGQTSVVSGQSVPVTVTAHDPDATSQTVTVTVTDSEGATGTGSVVILVSDPLTYAATADAGTVSGGGSSNVFSYTAP